MKLISFILSCYLLVLLVFPCCAFDDCPDGKDKTEQQADHGKDKDKDTGTCSPFFNCEKCASATMQGEQITFNILQWVPTRLYIDFTTSYFPSVHYDFWRPPQLG